MRLVPLLFLLLLVTSCTHSPLSTGAIAEENRYNMASLQVGMSDMQVAEIMGRPYNIETIDSSTGSYEVWYYITKPTGMGQRNVLPKNLTPLIFQDHLLKGWGREYYLYVSEDEEYMEQRKYLKEQQYSDDEEDWPPEDHRMIPEEKEEPQEEEKEPEEPAEQKQEMKPKKQQKPTPSKEDEKDYYWWQ